MQYLNISEYAKLKGVSRQAIQDRIRRGTLATVKRKVEKEMIPVTDTELVCVKS